MKKKTLNSFYSRTHKNNLFTLNAQENKNNVFFFPLQVDQSFETSFTFLKAHKQTMNVKTAKAERRRNKNSKPPYVNNNVRCAYLQTKHTATAHSGMDVGNARCTDGKMAFSTIKRLFFSFISTNLLFKKEYAVSWVKSFQFFLPTIFFSSCC